MLILTRRIGEKLVVGESTFFTVLGIKGNQVRLGINAPADVTVHREEIFLKVKAEQQAVKAQGRLDINLADTFRAHQKTTITMRQLTN